MKAIVVLLSLIVLTQAALAGPRPHFRVVELPVRTDAQLQIIGGFNDHGDLLINDYRTISTFILRQRQIIPIPRPVGADNIEGFRLNNAGQALVWTYFPGAARHFLYDDGELKLLPTYPGAIGTGYTDLNDAGVLSGMSFVPDGQQYWATNTRSYVLSNDVFTTLPFLNGDSPFTPLVINNAGVTAGHISRPSGLQAAAIYGHGMFTIISSNYAQPVDINNRNDVIGAYDVGRGFLFANGALRDLGLLPGYPYLTPSAINDAREIIGAATDPATETHVMFFWKDGKIWKLDDLVSEHRYGVTGVTHINNNGVIVAAVRDRGQPSRFVLLVPAH